MKKMKYCSVGDDSMIYVDGVRCSELEVKLDEGKKEIRLRTTPTPGELMKKVVVGGLNILGFMGLGYTITEYHRIREEVTASIMSIEQAEVRDLVGRGLERLADKISSYDELLHPKETLPRNPFTYVRDSSKGEEVFRYPSHQEDGTDFIAATFNEMPRPFTCYEPVTAKNVVFANRKPVGKTVLEEGQFVYVLAKPQPCFPEVAYSTQETNKKPLF